MKQKLLIALGGNAIITNNQKGTYQEQLTSVGTTTQLLSTLITKGHQLVITHGNGPQVGALLLQHAAASEQVPALPMDVCGSQTQGQLGYLFQQQLRNHFQAQGIQKEVCTIVSQTLVADDDPAFSHPTKPVGPFYSKQEIENKTDSTHVYKEDAGRGYRRIVPSPQPVRILEFPIIKQLHELGHIVIAAGGGGVPVIKKDNQYQGVEAVIDKDKTSALLAAQLKVDLFVILTGVDTIALHFNTPQQQELDLVTIKQAEQYISEGHFKPGSMLPKVEAAIAFVQKTGKKALITSPTALSGALEGSGGTWVTSN